MRSEIRALLNNDILNEAANHYGYDKSDLSDLHGFQNFVYGANHSSNSCIIRIAHSSHRSFSSTEAELDWIMYLSHHGVPAASPIRSLEGKLVHEINQGDSYFVCAAFEKAEGSKPHWQTYMNDSDLIQKIGRITGKIHALSKKYKIDTRVRWSKEMIENTTTNILNDLPFLDIDFV